MTNGLTKNVFLAGMALCGSIAATAPALALDEVSYGTNWLAQAEHGGFTRPLPTELTRNTA